jgi:hypothetical protein
MLSKQRGTQSFAPDKDDVVGVIPLGKGHGWVVRCPVTEWHANADETVKRVRDIAHRLLGRDPSSLIELVVGHRGNQGETETGVLSLFRAIEAEQGAVMIGMFSLCLDLEEISRMLATGEWTLIR